MYFLKLKVKTLQEQQFQFEINQDMTSVILEAYSKLAERKLYENVCIWAGYNCR